ncbi:uncharacterized protein [Ambystoma mexicanum]|uniref:uncharacterized protein isoform X2 n=1 Tax=Ambystoma mexicanum TaxID=8296 RepID=UPI0037E7F45F
MIFSLPPVEHDIFSAASSFPKCTASIVFFLTQGEDLCHVTVKRDGTTTSEKVVSSAEKAQEIFKHFHGSGIGAHCGINKTCDAVSQRYYWPNMYADVRNWVDPSKYHLLLGAVNEHHHWTLVAIYPCEKRAIYLNPLGEVESQIKKCKEATRAFLRKKDVPISRWACSTVIHPKQQDSISCGVFVCKRTQKTCATYVARGQQMQK